MTDIFVPHLLQSLCCQTRNDRLNQPVVPTNSSIRVVKAQSGDTVAKLAEREKVSPVEVAKFNGLFTTSKLTNGREIKVTIKSNQHTIYVTSIQEINEILGEKPTQMKNGKVTIVLNI